MSLDADQIVDRRRLSRRLTVWRVIAFVFALIAIVAVIGTFTGDLRDRTQPHIARVTVEGAIFENTKRDAMLERLAGSRSARGVMVVIDSPGGTTTGGEALYDQLRRIAEDRPVVAVIRTVGASAAYATAIAADHVVARETSITGSIGVYFQWANVEQLFDTIGIEMDTIKSDPLKAEPSPFSPTTPQERAVIQSLIDDSYAWFLRIFAERRDFDDQTARDLADGRIYSGRAALDNGMIDAIGGEREARQWLADEHGLSMQLDIVDWTPEGPLSDFDFTSALWRMTGLDRVFPQSRVLDGLISVWHPQLLED